MSLAPGPLCIVALIVAMGLTWIMVSILLGGPGSGFPRIQQLFISECGTLPCSVVEATSVASWACGQRLWVG
uniref:Protein FAM3A n=3 Tax=Canis lupus TaxID=9612 RepID=A0A8C0NII5_CANLF